MNTSLFSPVGSFQIETRRHNCSFEMKHFQYHNAYEVFLLLNGEHTFITMDNAFTLSPKCVSLIRPQCMHRVVGKAGNERVVLYFDEHFLRQYLTEESRHLLLSCFETDHLKLADGAYEEFLELLTSMQALKRDGEPGRIFPMFVRAMSLLCDARRAQGPEGLLPEKNDAPMVSSIISYLNHHYGTITSLEEIAEHFFITKYHLCRIFKAATNSTVMEHLNSIRLLHACRMLEDTSMSITDISYSCGFHSSAYFSGAFKKALGISPRAFRSQKRE